MTSPRLVLFFVLGATACVETGTSPISTGPDVQPIRVEPNDEEEPGAPIADAGEDRQVAPLEEIRLDGSRSFDPGGLDLIPEWRVVASPEGSQAVLDRADALDPILFPDVAGDYQIELSVVNTRGIRSKHADRVLIRAVPEDALYVQLTWDTDVDLDLHIVPDGAAVWGELDCTWCNPEPDWGARSVLVDDPSLDWDVIDGFGPETTTVVMPAPGRYRVFVDVYGQGGLTACRSEGCPVTTATLDVYVDGERVSRSLASLETAGELWEAVHVDWPSGEVIEVDAIGWTDVDDCQVGAR